MKISLAALRSAAENKPEGYLEDVLNAGEQADGFLFLAEDDYLKLSDRYGKPGFVAPHGIRSHRKTTCLACEHWNPHGWAGLGMCGICRCTSVMWWVSAKVCPDHPPRWPAFSIEKPTA